MELIELFGGIGACTKALKNIGMNVNVVDYVEIDKYAVKSYNAINGTNFEPQDIKEWDKDINVDIIMHGSPCQDFSVAGKQAGGDLGSGTRSSLLYETIRIVGKLRPKYVIWENVKNLLSKTHKHNFDNYIKTMNILGYNSYYQILNAKDYGIPQNRERVYTVSIRKDIDNGNFKFPKKEPLKIVLKDLLENKVDEKYYLKDYQIGNIKKFNYIQNQKRIQEKDYCDILCARDWKDSKYVRIGEIFDTEKSKHQSGSIYDKEGLAPSIDTMQGGNRQPKILIKNATKKGYVEAVEGDSINLAYPNSETRRGRVGHQVSQTLTVNNSIAVLDSQTRIRKLTPKECWRLMGFDDEDFYKAQSAGNSNSQLYKQAGNSIVVNVLEKIFLNLFN